MGLSQFQQIGGVGDTQWRELRRLDKITDPDLISMEPIRKAADESNWSRYTELMGDVFCKRVDQLIRPLYQNKIVKAIPNKEQVNSDNPHSLSRDTEHYDSAIAPNANPDISESQRQNAESIPENPALISESSLETHLETKAASKATPAPGNAEIHSPISTEQENTYSEHVSKLGSTCIEQESTCNPKRESDSNELGSAYNPKRESAYKELKQNRYGDALMTQLKGIVYLGVEIITRVHEWTLTHSHKPNAVNLRLLK